MNTVWFRIAVQIFNFLCFISKPFVWIINQWNEAIEHRIKMEKELKEMGIQMPNMLDIYQKFP